METVVALGVLAVLMVAMASFFVRILWSSDKSGDQSAGLQLADQILQDCIAQQAFEVAAVDHTVTLYTHDAAAPTEFTYRVTSEAVLLPECTRPSYAMDVHVTWFNQSPGTARSGHGKLETHLGRLVTP